MSVEQFTNEFMKYQLSNNEGMPQMFVFPWSPIEAFEILESLMKSYNYKFSRCVGFIERSAIISSTKKSLSILEIFIIMKINTNRKI